MLDFETARQRFIQVAPQLGSERVALKVAAGRILAEPLRAARAVPEFDTSAMDGYAIAAQNAQPLPFCLPVVGEAPAGTAPAELQPGTAMRIFTGAAVPAGADTVVMQEDVTRDGPTISCSAVVHAGQNVRKRGEDLAQGALALDRGQRLHAAALSLVSFLDVAEVTVARTPTVAILCTGSELRQPGSEARPGTIAESNSSTIALLAQQAGAKVLCVELVEDEATRIHHAISQALATADVLVTIGGVSVGDYDLVRPALEAAGVTLELYQVGIKPGKPITMGRLVSNPAGGNPIGANPIAANPVGANPIGSDPTRANQFSGSMVGGNPAVHKIVVGLPGNPTSAIITFALFAMPLLRAMQGDRSPIPVPLWVPAAAALKRDPKRTRVVLGNLVGFEGRTAFQAHANQSSGATIALGQTDGFAILEPRGEPAAVGAPLRYQRWTDL